MVVMFACNPSTQEAAAGGQSWRMLGLHRGRSKGGGRGEEEGRTIYAVISQSEESFTWYAMKSVGRKVVSRGRP
jgi:hypothetical protein